MKEGNYDFEESGAHIYNEIRGFLVAVTELMKTQPPANNLDESEKFLRNLNSYYAGYAQMMGKAESFYNAIAHNVINTIEDEAWKKIKNSSTLTDRYITGKFPRAGAVYNEMKTLGHVFRTVAENYRTLISSYRQEREFELRTQTRQQRPV